MNIVRNSLGAASLVMGLASVVPAHASYSVCNDTGLEVTVAIGYFDRGVWRSDGWWNVAPRACATPIGGDLNHKFYYYYARTINRDLVWKNATNTAFFCVEEPRKFDGLASNADCHGYNFRKVNVGDSVDYTTRLTESDKNPHQVAVSCADRIGDGMSAFAKCWTRGMATSKQKRILDCLDRNATSSSFAICAARESVDPSTLKIADCAARYMDRRVPSEFLTCVSQGALPAEQARVLECAINGRGNLSMMAGCTGAAMMNAEQRRMFDCVAQNQGSHRDMALCAAGSRLSPEQRRVVNCVINNRGSYAQMGLCAASGNALTSEQQVFVQCAATSGGQPYVFAGCVGGQLTLNEFQKCFTQGIGGRGCFGDNNTAVRFVKNAWKDVTEGPGPNNTGRVFVENNVTGPLKDFRELHFGRSDASVWRHMGLPEVKIQSPAPLRIGKVCIPWC